MMLHETPFKARVWAKFRQYHYTPDSWAARPESSWRRKSLTESERNPAAQNLVAAGDDPQQQTAGSTKTCPTPFSSCSTSGTGDSASRGSCRGLPSYQSPPPEILPEAQRAFSLAGCEATARSGRASKVCTCWVKSTDLFRVPGPFRVITT
jgi:hypothetical protein